MSGKNQSEQKYLIISPGDTPNFSGLNYSFLSNLNATS